MPSLWFLISVLEPFLHEIGFLFRFDRMLTYNSYPILDNNFLVYFIPLWQNVPILSQDLLNLCTDSVPTFLACMWMDLLFLSQPFPKITRKQRSRQTSCLPNCTTHGLPSLCNRWDLLKRILVTTDPLADWLFQCDLPGSSPAATEYKLLSPRCHPWFCWCAFVCSFWGLCVTCTLSIALWCHALS